MYLMKNILCFTYLGLLFSSTTLACVYTPGFILRITNNIPNSKVLARCKSKDTDFGDKWLAFNQDFQWKFCEAYFEHTLYFCHFYWESKEQVFEVFNKRYMYECNIDHGDDNPCYWLVQEDGFYLYDFNKKSWGKRADWKPRTAQLYP